MSKTKNCTIVEIWFFKGSLVKEMLKEKPVAYSFFYCRWDDYVDQIMSLMVNVSLNDNSHSVIISAEFPSTFDKDIKLIIKKHHKVANKFFNLTSKMSKEPKYILQLLQTNNVFSCFFESIEPTNDLADDSIRLLARFLDLDYTCAKIEECKIDTDKFSVNIRATLKDACETQKKERYANGCTLANRFLKRYPKYLPEFKELIAMLIKTSKDEVGIMRKNAAILLSIIAMDESNKEIVRNLHGIEVLASIKDFL